MSGYNSCMFAYGQVDITVEACYWTLWMWLFETIMKSWITCCRQVVGRRTQ